MCLLLASVYHLTCFHRDCSTHLWHQNLTKARPLRTQTFEIKPKGVNITVNFNVTMGAEDLATQIYKGNKKNKKEGFFVLTEEAKSAELEGTKGTA